MTTAIWFAKKIVPFVEQATRTTINIRRTPRVRVKVHSKAASDGTSMQQYAELIRRTCTFIPRNIYEIGANYGQDAEALRRLFGLLKADVHIFEPHPELLKEARVLYGFHCHELAVSNVTGTALFHAIDIDQNEYGNSGISSLKRGPHDPRNFRDIEVPVIRMEDFIAEHSVTEIDFLKLDVEGANYEALDGFGKALSIVKAIQVEGEHVPCWEGQRLYAEIETLLRAHGFELVYFTRLGDGTQSDSLWVQSAFLRHRA